MSELTLKVELVNFAAQALHVEFVLVEPEAGITELAFQAAQVVDQFAALLFAAAVLFR